MNDTWQAVERYAYTAYGKATIYTPDWSNTRASSLYNNTTLYTGRELDASTSLYYYRARYYSADLGSFVGRDPLVYEAKDFNLNRYVHNDPTNATDPGGLIGMLEPPICWTGGWEPNPENKEVQDRLRDLDNRVKACIQRCLKASGTRGVLCIGMGASPVVSLPLKPIGVRHCGAPTPTWSTFVRKFGGTSCRAIGRRCNPLAAR